MLERTNTKWPPWRVFLETKIKSYACPTKKKLKSLFFLFFSRVSMSDRWDDGGGLPPCPACYGCPSNEVKPVIARTIYPSGMNAYCADMDDCRCHDPRRYRVSKGTWYLPIQRSHVLPVAPYALFKAPNLLYTPRPSYLNMVANDPCNPLHYMAKSDGSRFIG